MIERFRRRDYGHMDYQITIDDPKAYTKPWTVTIPLQLFPDNELKWKAFAKTKKTPSTWWESDLMRILQTMALILAFSGAAAAQWMDLKLPNTPRMADGKPDLQAPTPKTPEGKPDLSGVWRVGNGRYLQNIAADLGEPPFQPWAAVLYKERVDALGRGRPSERCIPHGIPDGMLVRNFPFPFNLYPDTELIESICENERDREHMVGK